MWPEEYPPKPAPVLRNTSCCEMEVPGHLPWGMVHVLAHSRIPFSAESVAQRTGVPVERVRDVLAQAEQEGWIGPMLAESYMAATPAVYVGHLPKRR